MSTNANLPAGFTITTIGGRRCTKAPRSLTTFAGETSFSTSTTTAAATTTTSTTSAVQAQTTTSEETTTSSARDNPPNATTSIISESSAASTTSIAPTPEPTTTSSPLAAIITSSSLAAPTTSAVIVETVTPPVISNITSTPSTFAVPVPVAVPVAVSVSTTTTPTISPSTQIAIAQSDISQTPTAAESADNGLKPIVASTSSSTSITAVIASAKPEVPSAAAGISSKQQSMTMPLVGGVVGGVAFVSLIGLLLWFFRRRKRRVASLTSLTTGRGQFYEIDRDSVGPTNRSAKWIENLGYQTNKLHNAATGFTSAVSGIGASLKSRVVGDRSDTPGVNLNRGNSQFLDGPIPQHSRNNSSVLSSHTGNLTIKAKLQDWWERCTENLSFNWRLRNKKRESEDPFAAARGMTEKRTNMNGTPDFSQLLGMDDRELRLQAERRHASLSSTFPGGDLGLDFSSLDPFADPPPTTISQQQNQAWQPPNPTPQANPFADPIIQPQSSFPKPASYISDVRRSRGLSIDNGNPNVPPQTKTSSITPTSRYPSSIPPNRDSVFSSFSTTARKGKGRSDPFDLERPELWRPVNPPIPAPGDSTKDLYPDPWKGKEVMRDSGVATPRPVSPMTPRVVSGSGTYGSKYSSGVSSLGEWGDPGPDLGTGGLTKIYTSGGVGGWDERRRSDNISPLSVDSKVSSKGGVGKAM